MSVYVDLNKPELTDEERRYLLERGRMRDLRIHDRRFGSGKAAVKEAPEGTRDHETSVEQNDWREYVDSLTVEELREELSDRNLDTEGRKAVLVDRLKTAGPNN